MKKLKVGIIGLGVGEKHIPIFESHPACEVVALCDFSKKKLSDITVRYPNIFQSANSDEILNDTNIDVVSVASFDKYHFEQVAKSIENKKHVFVEKPLCLDFHEAVEIRRLLNENPGICLSSNLNLRTCPMFTYLKDIIQSGYLGEIFYLEGDYLWGRINKLTGGWRKDMPFYSIVYGAAVHMIDLLMWITQMNPVEVKGYGNRIATDNTDFKFDDFSAILMTFENGMIAKISANSACVHPHFHKISVYGTLKSFFHDIMGGRIVKSRESVKNITNVKKQYPAVREKAKTITTFIDSIFNSNTEAIVPAEDVFKTMSVCFAAEKAIKEGVAVPVKYI